jgi:hypothetical protein
LEKENLGIAVGVLERARCARVSFGEIATERSSDLTFASAQEHLSARRRFPLVGRPQGKIIMRLATIGLATALALTSTFALAHGAAGASAGANRTLNPSGNSYINTSPSGSTLGPNGPSSGVGR